MIKLDNKIKNGGIVLFFVVAIIFAEWRKDQQKCKSIDSCVLNDTGSQFISDQDINDVVTAFGKRNVVGGKLIHISLKTVCEAVKSNNFVESVSVVKNHAGILNIKVTQAEPIARVFTKDSSFYLTRSDSLIDLSNKYTSRVLLVRGLGVKKFVENCKKDVRKNSSFFTFFRYINEDEFLRKQVAEVHIGKDGELTIFPQVTKQVIEFGEPNEIVDKFERLKLFYKKVLPEKGWNHYERVNLKYKNQIICS